MSNAPCLILALSRTPSVTHYKGFIWILTFFVYTSYHLSRRPITVVKNALHQKCVNTSISFANGTQFKNSCVDHSWEPFGKNDPYEDYFGALDVSYLAGYAVGMFISGHVAERMNLRYFLSLGMTLSGIMTLAFGFGYSWQIHSLAYFVIVQAVCGVVQSSGWPGVVAVMGSWFGKGRRGLIMGIWNAHTSLGNILGGLIASAFLTSYWREHGYWMWSFFFPGLIIMVLAVVVFFTLVPSPRDVGLPPPGQEQIVQQANGEQSPLINDTDALKDADYGCASVMRKSGEEDMQQDGLGPSNPLQTRAVTTESEAISFLGAVKVPGVVEFALCLFFAKLVSYTFLYWLPQYIKQVMTKHVHMADPDAKAGDLATLVDVGGIFGAIFAGFLADVTGSSAITCAVMLIFSIPMMVLYRLYGAFNMVNATLLLLATGFMVNGPYCLITTSVSADLGTHPSLASSAKALATVTAIIDGTGSIGAAIGPGLTAIIEGTKLSLYDRMNAIFAMLIVSNVCALLLLSRLIYKEVMDILQKRYYRAS